MSKRRPDNDRTFVEQLRDRDDFASYGLRTTFFHRRLRSMRLWEAIDEVHRLSNVSNGFIWQDRTEWGVEEAAWQILEKSQILPLAVFCHPRVLFEQPKLLIYYRTLALISQKGLSTLVGGEVAKIENGDVAKIAEEKLNRIVITLNCLISMLIAAASDLQLRDLPGLQFASAGATIQGSWNNEIGSAGEAAVRTILLRHLQSQISQIVWKDSKSTEFDMSRLTEALDRVGDIRILRLQTGHHVVFASEPDISLRDSMDLPVLAIEVKAGSDPAAALERLGAAMKSFENDRNANPQVKTVYVVRSMTQELRKRIDENNPFDYTFSLADLLSDERTQRTFGNIVVSLVLGKKRR